MDNHLISGPLLRLFPLYLWWEANWTFPTFSGTLDSCLPLIPLLIGNSKPKDCIFAHYVSRKVGKMAKCCVCLCYVLALYFWQISLFSGFKNSAVPWKSDCHLTIYTLRNFPHLFRYLDKLTANFFRLLEDFTPVQHKAPQPLKIDKQIPPYNGFGSEEDSLCSCLGLLPKPPQRDFKKFMEKDRYFIVCIN